MNEFELYLVRGFAATIGVWLGVLAVAGIVGIGVLLGKVIL